IAGFVGVLIALRPSAATLTWPALIVLTGSIAFAFLMIVTRLLRDTHDIMLMTSQMSGTFALGAVTTPFAWVTPSPYDLMFLVAIGAISIGAQLSINRSLKLAPASVVVPYQYSMLVWAILFGYLAFGDVPDVLMLIGSAIIVAAGLYIFWRERAIGRPEQAFTPPPCSVERRKKRARQNGID